MFPRKRSATVPATPEPDVSERPGAKNRPTPKRREREAANRRPLVGGAKANTAEQKAKVRAGRAKAREGMLRGDEKYLGARDRGPIKRFLRDAVDTRWNIGEFLLPLMLIILAMSLINQPWARLGVFGGAYGMILIGILDSILLWRRTKKKVIEVFGQDPPKGSASYVVLRAFQMRLSRVPRPQIKRGEPLVRRG